MICEAFLPLNSIALEPWVPNNLSPVHGLSHITVATKYYHQNQMFIHFWKKKKIDLLICVFIQLFMVSRKCQSIQPIRVKLPILKRYWHLLVQYATLKILTRQNIGVPVLCLVFNSQGSTLWLLCSNRF